jgi:hypothetical protein
MYSQFVQDEGLEHGLFENKHQMPNQFVWEEAPEHRLFVLDKLQIPRQFVQDEALGPRLGHKLFALKNF